MDWEIAKWAKLPGAGSTAFPDLLAIEGVSNYCVSACYMLTLVIFKVREVLKITPMNSTKLSTKSFLDDLPFSVMKSL